MLHELVQSTDTVQGQSRDVAVLKEKAGRSRQPHLELRNSLKPWGSIHETDRWGNRDPARTWCLPSSPRAGDMESRKPLS